MLRETQKSKAKPNKSAQDFIIKDWLFRKFKEKWWNDDICDCSALAGIKPCYSCKHWKKFIKMYKQGKLK